MSFLETAKAIGQLVEEKNRAYGDSFARSGEIMKVLYPKGIQPEQYEDMLGIVRVLDKLFRIATDKDAFGESPWRDVAGYGILGAERNSGKTNGGRQYVGTGDCISCRHSKMQHVNRPGTDAYDCEFCKCRVIFANAAVCCCGHSQDLHGGSNSNPDFCKVSQCNCGGMHQPKKPPLSDCSLNHRIKS